MSKKSVLNIDVMSIINIYKKQFEKEEKKFIKEIRKLEKELLKLNKTLPKEQKKLHKLKNPNIDPSFFLIHRNWVNVLKKREKRIKTKIKEITKTYANDNEFMLMLDKK
jgi:hypothetical protein